MLAWLVPLGLWLILLRFTAMYAVDVPLWDSWEHTEFVTGVRPLSLSYLWEQHNEHRLVWEKLVVYALWARATGWDEYGAAFFPDILIGLGSSVFLLAALRRRPQLSSIRRAVLIVSLAGLLFTLRQWENLIWSAGFSWALLFLIAVLFGEAFQRWAITGRGWWRVALLMVVAPLCSAHGLTLPVFVAAFLLLPGRDAAVGASTRWVLVLGMGLAIYLLGYQAPERHPDLLAVLHRPGDAAAYALIWLGSPFVAVARPAACLGFGLALAVLAAINSVVAAGSIAQRARSLCVAYPNLVVGALVLAMMTVGRAGLGPSQATASRYVSFSVLVVATGWLALYDAIERWPRTPRALAAVALLLVSISAWSVNYVDAGRRAAGVLRSRIAFRDCAQSHPGDLSPCRVMALDSPLARRPLAERVELLRAHHLSFFRPDRR